MCRCTTLLPSENSSTTDKLQRLLNVAACLVSDMRKIDRSLRQLIHVEQPSLARRTGMSEVQARVDGA